MRALLLIYRWIKDDWSSVLWSEKETLKKPKSHHHWVQTWNITSRRESRSWKKLTSLFLFHEKKALTELVFFVVCYICIFSVRWIGPDKLGIHQNGTIIVFAALNLIHRCWKWAQRPLPNYHSKQHKNILIRCPRGEEKKCVSGSNTKELLLATWNPKEKKQHEHKGRMNQAGRYNNKQFFWSLKKRKKGGLFEYKPPALLI